jgi:putative inorganic carbon (hco3(-)) transporter
MDAAPRRPRYYLLQESVLIVSLGLLLILVAVNNDWRNYSVLLTEAFLFTLMGLAWLVWGKRAATPLTLPIFLLLLAYMISVFFSRDPRRSLTEFINICLTITLFSLSADLVAWRWQPNLILKAVLIVGALDMVMSWLGVLGFYQQWVNANTGLLLPPFIYRLPDPNVQAWNLNPVVMIAFVQFWLTKSKAGKIGLGLFVLSGWALIFLSSSRGAWLGLAAGLAMAVYLLLYKSHFDFGAKWQELRQKKILLAGIVILVLMVGLGGGYILYHQTMHPSHAASFVTSRQPFWAPAIQTIFSAPLLGKGLFTFGTVLISTYSEPYFGLYFHAHSVPLNLAAETGLVGLAAFLFLYACLGLALRKRFLMAWREDRWINIAALAVLATITIHSLVDCFIGVYSGTWVVAILMGAALGVPRIEKENIGRPWWVVIPILALWAIVWMLQPMYAGQQAVEKGDWATAAENYREAVRRDAFSAITHQQYALAESQLAIRGDSSALTVAILEMQEAVHLDPSWALNHANLGALYLDAGQQENGIRELNQALQMANQSDLYTLLAGEAAELTRDDTRAAAEYSTALTIRPAWAQNYFWRQTPFRQKFIKQWLQDHPVGALLTRDELLLMLKENPFINSVSNQLAEMDLAQSDLPGAKRYITQATFTADGSAALDRVETIWLRAELAAADGNISQALLWGEAALDAFRHPGLIGPGTTEGSYYAQFAFREPVMNMELVPQMKTVTIPDYWVERVLKMADWYKQTGQPQKADDLLKELAQWVPDYQTIQR